MSSPHTPCATPTPTDIFHITHQLDPGNNSRQPLHLPVRPNCGRSAGSAPSRKRTLVHLGRYDEGAYGVATPALRVFPDADDLSRTSDTLNLAKTGVSASVS